MNNTLALSTTKRKIYVLNIVVNVYDLKELKQIGDMYGSFLGDLNAVNSHVHKLSSDAIVSQNNEFILIPIYLHYFKDLKQSSGNKKIIFSILEMVHKEIKKTSSANTCDFVFFLHGHGYAMGESDEESYLVVEDGGQKKSDQISKKEIYHKISPILKYADCYFVLNSCESAPGDLECSAANCKDSIFYKKFKDYKSFKNHKYDHVFYSLGMSSDKVYKDRFDRMSYGIKILKGIMEIGLKQDVRQLFTAFTTLLSNLNENNKKFFYLPKLIIISTDGLGNNSGPIITTDTYMKWKDDKSELR